MPRTQLTPAEACGAASGIPSTTPAGASAGGVCDCILGGERVVLDGAGAGGGVIGAARRLVEQVFVWIEMQGGTDGAGAMPEGALAGVVFGCGGGGGLRAVGDDGDHVVNRHGLGV